MDELLALWPQLTESQQAAVTDVARKLARPVVSQWLSVSALCTEYGQSPRTVYMAIKNGELEARVPYGKTRGYRVRRSDFEHWLGLL